MKRPRDHENMNDDRRALGRRINPPIYLVAAGTLMIVLHLYTPGAQLIQHPWNWLGAVPMVAGVAFTIWARAFFKRAGTAAKPFTPPKTLVRAGPYALSRNPMYVGLVVMLAGLAISLGSVMPWVIVPLFIWRIQVDVISVEEGMIESTFGGAYQDYKSRVRRWL